MVKLNINQLPVLNYTLVNNKIGICQEAEITNTSAQDLYDVVVESCGEFFLSSHSEMTAVIKAGQTVRLQEIGLRPNPEKVAAITEKTLSTFTLSVKARVGEGPTKEVFTQDYQISVMPYECWLGMDIFPQSIASFVIPNHPMVSQIVTKAAHILKELTGSSAFTEYQTCNTSEVRKQVAAVFGALHAEGIIYRSLPPSYEKVGQRVTLPDQVLSTKMGNCIELSILFASVLESVGINSVLVFQQGHCYLGVWLVDDCCQYSVCDDASFMEKKCSDGIDEMMVLECTQIASEKTSFEMAEKIAEKSLADLSRFHYFIDIKRCRLEQILPLPFKVQPDGRWVIDTEGVKHDDCLLNIRERSRYDLTRVMESKNELTKMDIWERKLLDFTLRNTMLNLSLSHKAIQFISFDVSKIEDQLSDGNEYVISEKPNVEIHLPQDDYIRRSKLAPGLHQLISSDIQHHILHTYETELETRNTLKNIYRSARNAIEETGANALYLAIGTLRWFETELSEKPRYAPIMMLPVDILYKKGEYYIRTRDEETALNITLIEFLRQNYDIDIPGLYPLPKDEHGVDVTMVFAIIREALKNKKRWDVEEEALLGIFSFSKFLMWNDIHNHREQLLSNDVVRSLVEQKLTYKPSPVISDLKDADKEMKPESLALPVSVDSSQMAAVIEAGRGHSFILYGPPGTGKSQTITNLIANALYQGKRVLFVAEKMAALSVVQTRLEKIGLAPFCLEMHSNKITKRHVLDQLKKALGVTHIVRPEDYQRTAEQLYAQRTKLIEYMEALHDTKDSDGMSVYDCIVRYEAIEAEELDIDTNDPELKQHFCIKDIDTYRHLLYDKYRAIVSLIGQPCSHPLIGLDITEADLADVSSFARNLKAAADNIQWAIDNQDRLANVTGLKNAILRDCSPQILHLDGNALYQEWREAKAKWFLPRYFAKKNYLNKLRQYNNLITEAEVDVLLNRLLDYQSLHQDILRVQASLKHYSGMECQEDCLPSIQEMTSLVEKLQQWSAHSREAKDWYQWCAFKEELAKAGLAVVARKIMDSSVPADSLCDSFLKAMFHTLASEKISRSTVLRTFEGSIFDETVARYTRLTEEFQMLSQKELYARLASQIPHVTDSIDSSSEIGLLNRNISNGGRGLSLRDLIDQIPTLMPRLCPCMLMSPMSVAQFLDLSQEKFDLVVFDEASQMPTSEAVGAIARGKAVIVVGDPKQMPPTSFFSSSNVSEEEAELDDMESILEDCRTLDIPSLQLNWHYRSKHESLIAFSNNEYYDGSLITFPSVDDQTTKVIYRYVNGVYDKGGRRSNKKEAEAVVQEIARLLAQPEHARRSIGVIAFSVVQQYLIEDLLMEMLEKNKSLREAADEIYEPIFVKNLENVQGDERDIILFSIGYGPDKQGKVSMNFGPLNNAGGERRLNVAVSRARREMMVFSALKSSHIDLRRSKAKGVEGLKHFLEYAEQQILVQTATASNVNADSAIAGQIATELRKRGYVVNTNVGRSHFKVDIAISESEEAGNYSLGLLLDGKGYHQTQTTRDREIVQPSVLRSLNWKIMRVWSVDWMNNPERVLQRIENCLKDTTPQVEEAPQAAATFDISQEAVEEKVKSSAQEYTSFVAPARVDELTDRELAIAIVESEQPITLPYLCKKVCTLRLIPRVTPTMLATMTNIAVADMYIDRSTSPAIVWKDEESARTYTGYRHNSGRDITEIPHIEVVNAISEALVEQFAIRADALTLIVAKKLGFTRRGTKVEQAIDDALAQLISQGKILSQDGKLTLAAG